jgi:hypothetical protein
VLASADMNLTLNKGPLPHRVMWGEAGKDNKRKDSSYG